MAPPSSSASSTFSRAVSVGRSWKNWKTIPTVRPRHRASPFSLISPISCPAKTTRPEVGRSIPVRMLSSVDLPLPEGPLIANRLCRGTANDTESRIVVDMPLLPMIFVIASACTRTSVPWACSTDLSASCIANRSSLQLVACHAPCVRSQRTARGPLSRSRRGHEFRVTKRGHGMTGVTAWSVRKPRRAASEPALLAGDACSLYPVAGVDLLDRDGEVVSHRAAAQVQRAGDRLHARSVGAERQDLLLAGRQRAGPVAERRDGELGVEDLLSGRDPTHRHGQLVGRGVLQQE